MKVEAVSVTQVLPNYLAKLQNEIENLPPEYGDIISTPEGLMAFTARVSSPNQTNPSISKLLKYCMEQGHWSVFEMAEVTFEITTSRAIAAQMLRHKSLSFQEFSQRYASASTNERHEARSQDKKNRQASNDDLDEDTKEWFRQAQDSVEDNCFGLYRAALKKGIAKEQARFLLPLSTTTRLYAKGSIRSWLHYIKVRSVEAGAQLEHAQIAEAIKLELKHMFPAIAEAAGW